MKLEARLKAERDHQQRIPDAIEDAEWKTAYKSLRTDLSFDDIDAEMYHDKLETREAAGLEALRTR